MSMTCTCKTGGDYTLVDLDVHPHVEINSLTYTWKQNIILNSVD